MSIKIESLRFGPLEVDEDQVIDFPRGLIGIPGRRYALVDINPEGVFRWLHSVEHPSFALPVVNPLAVVPSFALTVDDAERERAGLKDLGECEVYVTVKADPDPAATTLNLRAPLVIVAGHGYQVLNSAPGALLQAPLMAEPVRMPEGAAR